MVLDLSAVTFIGTLCLQCFIAAAKAARASQARLTFIRVPDPVAGQMAHMGMPPEAVEALSHAA